MKIRRRSAVVFGVWFGSGGLGLVHPAWAEEAAPPVGLVEGRTRLSLSGEVVGLESRTASGGPTAGGTSTTVGLGLPGSSQGVGVGYGVAEDFLLGARLQLSSRSMAVEGLDAPVSSTTVGLHARPELLFGEGSARPFLGLDLGYTSTVASSGAGARQRSSGAALGATLGVHLFATDSFSIDPSATVAYVTGSERFAGVGVDTSGPAVSVGLALSGWLGSARARAREAEAPSSEDAASSPPPGRAASVAGSWTLALEGGARVTFAAADDGTSDAAVRYITPERWPELESCRSITFSTERRELELGPLERTTVVGGSAVLLVLTGRLPLGDVQAVAVAEERLVVEGCGAHHAVAVPYRALEGLRDLARVLKARPRPEARSGDADAAGEEVARRPRGPAASLRAGLR